MSYKLKPSESKRKPWLMPLNRWDPTAAAQLPDLEALVYRSNLLGQDRTVVNIYGGNTSTKLQQIDHLGNTVEVLAVKASGSDLATITEAGFALLKLAEVLPLFTRAAMTDEDMVAYLNRTAFEPGRPRQSIETLLHAFVPFAHVDHTHPDAIISLACAPDGEAAARAVFGQRLGWVPYIKPGFTLSQWIGQQVQQQPALEGVVMGKHGLVTWGTDSASCYAQTIRIIQEAVDYLAERTRGKRVFGDLKTPALSTTERQQIMTQTLPILRGGLSQYGSVILRYDDSDPVLDYVGSAQTAHISQQGAACPDHLVYVKRQPLFIDWHPSQGVPALLDRLIPDLQAYAERYHAYFEQHRTPADEPGNPLPRVILIPGVGMVTCGSDVHNAEVSRQLVHWAIQVIGGAEALGGFTSLTEAEAFAIEYWPLERYKLKLAPPPREYAGKVVLITGGASGIGRATAFRLAAEGAHVVIADIHQENGESTAAALNDQFGADRALFQRCDVTDEAAIIQVFEHIILTYGGLDVLVNNAGIAGGAPLEETTLAMWNQNLSILATGYFLMAREAFRVMKRQGSGGSMVFVASKNAIDPAKGSVAYNAAKAAELHMARSLAEEGGVHNIRVNTVLPGIVIQGSSIWNSEWKAHRARQYGVTPDELTNVYRQRNALKANLLPEDIAEAITFLAGPRARYITGAVLSVDGGVLSAYVR